MLILFSCTFALAAEGYAIPHHNGCLYNRWNKMITKKCTYRLRYFTQRVLYNSFKVKVNEKYDVVNICLATSIFLFLKTTTYSAFRQ